MFGRDPREMILSIPAILLAFTFHEYAHAMVADKLGDRTPRFQGRITLNPIAHIDLLGFILFLFAGFGWAKPVQTNPSAYRNYYKDDMKVSVAGPVANLILAVIFVPIFLLCNKYFFYEMNTNKVFSVIGDIILYIPYYNVLLFVLNLIPIPGFDGYHIVSDLFPSTFNELNYKMGNYQLIIMIVFVAVLAPYIISLPTRVIFKGLFSIFSFIG